MLPAFGLVGDQNDPLVKRLFRPVYSEIRRVRLQPERPRFDRLDDCRDALGVQFPDSGEIRRVFHARDLPDIVRHRHFLDVYLLRDEVGEAFRGFDCLF